MPVFVSNCIGENQESNTTDQCHHILSSDNSADTVSRWSYSEGHRESSWINGPSRLKTTNWPLETDTKTVDKIRLKEHSCDTNICLENLSSFVSNVLHVGSSRKALDDMRSVVCLKVVFLQSTSFL